MARPLNVVGKATLTVSNTAVDLVNDASPNLPSKANRMFLTVEDDAIRWWADGTDPTATEGHKIDQDDPVSFTGANYRSMLENMKFIRVTADAKLKITYFD